MGITTTIYKKEDKNESASISRDLSSALLSGKIVCLGYANIFNIIAKLYVLYTYLKGRVL